MAILAQFWSERVAISTENSSREQLIVHCHFLSSFALFIMLLLYIFQAPITIDQSGVNFTFQPTCETHIWLVDSYTIWDKFAQVYYIALQRKTTLNT